MLRYLRDHVTPRSWGGAVPCLLVALAAVGVSFPLWPSAVLNTQANDLANHVRHVHEYHLALRERQLPPLVAPSLNGATRIPLFQYYSGTAYVVPGVFAWSGLDPYTALKLAIIFHSLAAGLAVLAAGRRLGFDRWGCLTAALAFQLFPFGAVDLYNRGGYPEWLALEWLPVLLACALRLVPRRPPLALARGVLALALAWAYFVPIHPLQTLYGGGLLAAVVLVHAWRAAPGLSAPRRIVLGYVLGALLSAWFWLPVVLDFGNVQNLGHQLFANAWFTWPLLLSPWFQSAPQIHGWAPQLGPHFLAAAGAVLLTRPSLRRLPWVAAVVFVGLLLLMMHFYELPLAQRLCRPLQFTYRLLIPAAVVGTVCVGWAVTALGRRLPAGWPGFVARLALPLYVVVTGVPYFLPEYVGLTGRANGVPVAKVVAADFRAPNSSQYAFFGTDLRELGWLEDGRLSVNRDHFVPWEGVPLEFCLAVESEADLSRMRFLVGGEPRLFGVRPLGGRAWELNGLVISARGNGRPEQDARFDLPGDPDPVFVHDFRARAVGASQNWFRMPATCLDLGGRTTRSYQAVIQSGRPGLYQLPVHYFPGLHVRVNGEEVAQASADLNMVVVPLTRGSNRIEVIAQPHPLALALMAVGAVAWGVGYVWLWLLERRRRARVATLGALSPVAPLARAA